MNEMFLGPRGRPFTCASRAFITIRQSWMKEEKRWQILRQDASEDALPVTKRSVVTSCNAYDRDDDGKMRLQADV